MTDWFLNFQSFYIGPYFRFVFNFSYFMKIVPQNLGKKNFTTPFKQKYVLENKENSIEAIIA